MIRIILFILLLTLSQEAFSFSATLGNTPRSIYLRVGDGGYTGYEISSGTPQNYAFENTVSLQIPPTQLGNSVPQYFVSDAVQTTSFYDGRILCNLPNEVYIGGFYRQAGNGSDAILTVTSPSSLINSLGQTIPFNQISWTSSGNGDVGAQPIPAGTFSGSTQTIASFPRRTWQESCHRFSYQNQNIIPSGTYTGTVTYTLSTP